MSGSDRGAVVWLTGLPASGKSTLARAVRAALAARGVACAILDSDEVREALRPPPGYDDAGRDAFYETVARVAALLASQGLVVLVAATAHRRAFRERARALAPHFVEVSVTTSAEVCAARDPKGLYAASRSGDITTLPGAGAGYEPPEHPEVTAAGGDDPAAVAEIVARVGR